MDIKKTVTIEGVRSWTGRLENYEAHKECAEHWCGGGEIEAYDDYDNYWYGADSHRPLFFPAIKYRIKRREPVNGEVWLSDGLACIYTDAGDKEYPLLQIDGEDACKFDTDAIYAAPSIESYIAKKLLDKVEQYTEQGFKAHALYEVVEAAAGEE